MSRFEQLKARLFKDRGEKRAQMNNRTRIDTIALRAKNKKLKEDTELYERKVKLMQEEQSYKARGKKAKKKAFAIRTAPIKNAFATAKKITKGTQKVMGKIGSSKTNSLLGGTGSVSPLTQGGGNPFYPEQKKEQKKMRKRRVRIIDYE